MKNLNPIDRRVLESLSGRDKLEALLSDHGYPSLRAVADALGEDRGDVSRCFNGYTGRWQTQDRIRSAVADLVDISREDVDALLGPLQHTNGGSDE